MSDFSPDMMQKKLRMASNTEGYRDILDQQNVLLQENTLTQENFQRFEQGGWNTENEEEQKRATLFRSQLKETIMWDKESAREFKDEEAYKDIFEEAKKEKKQLKIDANRTGAGKVFHDITGSKKKRAKDKLERMAKLEERNEVKALIEEKRADMDALITDTETKKAEAIQKAKNYLAANEPDKDASQIGYSQAKPICLKYEKTKIIPGMSEKEKEDARSHNEKLEDEYSELTTKDNFITSSFIDHGHRGAYAQRSVLLHLNDKHFESNKRCDEFKKKYPNADTKGLGGAAASDIVRDLGRWVKSIDDTRDVPIEEMKEAFDHAVKVHTVTILGAEKEVARAGKVETVDTYSRDDYLASVNFCTDKLELYQNKAKEFLNAHPELMIPYPKYADLVRNCEQIQEFYKIGQSLSNLGKDVYYSIYRYNKTTKDKESLFKMEDVEKAKNIASEVSAATSTFFQLSQQAVKWDEASTDQVNIPMLEDMKEKLKGLEIQPFEKATASRKADIIGKTKAVEESSIKLKNTEKARQEKLAAYNNVAVIKRESHKDIDEADQENAVDAVSAIKIFNIDFFKPAETEADQMKLDELLRDESKREEIFAVLEQLEKAENVLDAGNGMPLLYRGLNIPSAGDPAWDDKITSNSYARDIAVFRGKAKMIRLMANRAMWLSLKDHAGSSGDFLDSMPLSEEDRKELKKLKVNDIRDLCDAKLSETKEQYSRVQSETISDPEFVKGYLEGLSQKDANSSVDASPVAKDLSDHYDAVGNKLKIRATDKGINENSMENYRGLYNELKEAKDPLAEWVPIYVAMTQKHYKIMGDSGKICTESLFRGGNNTMAMSTIPAGNDLTTDQQFNMLKKMSAGILFDFDEETHTDEELEAVRQDNIEGVRAYYDYVNKVYEGLEDKYGFEPMTPMYYMEHKEEIDRDFAMVQVNGNLMKHDRTVLDPEHNAEDRRMKALIDFYNDYPYMLESTFAVSLNDVSLAVRNRIPGKKDISYDELMQKQRDILSGKSDDFPDMAENIRYLKAHPRTQV